MRGPFVPSGLAIVLAIAGPAACAQIDGLSGLKYDRGSGGSAEGGGGTSSETNSVGVGGNAAGGSGAGASGAGGSGVGGSDGCTCVNVPEGWRGPIVFFKNGGAGETCPVGYPSIAFDGGQTPADEPVTCNACVCGGEPCGSFSVNGYSSNNCAAVSVFTNVPATRACYDLGAIDALSVRVELVPANPGTMCSSSGGGVATRPATHFSDRAFGCTAPKLEACDDGVCAPKAPPDGDLCIYKVESGSACPSGYTTTTVFRTITDGRDCDACGCGTPVGPCNGEVELFADTTCSGEAAPVPPDDSCYAVSPYASAMSTVLSPCNTKGGAPKGATSGASPVTVCCQ